VKVFSEKIKVMNAKLCLPGYKSNLGDFVSTIDGDQDIIFFYHLREKDFEEKTAVICNREFPRLINSINQIKFASMILHLFWNPLFLFKIY
jgi:hypothetical protein